MHVVVLPMQPRSWDLQAAPLRLPGWQWLWVDHHDHDDNHDEHEDHDDQIDKKEDDDDDDRRGLSR